MIDAKTLQLVTQDGLQHFASGRILNGIAALSTLLPYCPAETVVHVEAESLEENYHHMLAFLRSGGNDEKRSEVQEKIQRKGVALLEQASRAIRIILDKDRYCEALKQASPNPTAFPTLSKGGGNRQDNASSSLARDGERLSPALDGLREAAEAGERLFIEMDERQDDVFDFLWTSPLWSAHDTALWYDFMLGQRDMVQQHLMGALFLSAWEYFDAEKMQLLNLMTESECHRTQITAITYLLLLRLRYIELVSLMPPLPDKLLSRKGRKLIAKVEYEFLLMLVSEKDMERELKEADSLTKELLGSKHELSIKTLKDIITLRGRYLRNRLHRGLDINLSKIPLLHSCEYMRRVSHWFMPFDKTHPLFQSVMYDENGKKKQPFSTIVDLIMDCDVDKLALLHLVKSDKDFSNALQQLDKHELPDIENAAIPEYTFRFIIYDLYRFFCHSPLHTQLLNPFREARTLLSLPEFASLFSIDDTVGCCRLLLELGRTKQALAALDDIIRRQGASADALLLKGQILKEEKKYAEAISSGRSAEMLEPDNADILRLLVECYVSLHRYEEELEYLQKLAHLLPDDKGLRRLIPSTLSKMGRKEEALALLFKLDYEMEEDDEHRETVLSAIADTALALGKTDLAERYTEKQMERKDKFGDCEMRLGHIRLLQGNWKDALSHYEQFVNIFCKETGKDPGAALSLLDRQWAELRTQNPALLTGEGRPTDKDLLLIHDILQAATDKAPKAETPEHGEE